MRITVEKITDVTLARKACSYTLHSQSDTKIPLRKLYMSEHSPARTQIFTVEMVGIPSYVSTHLVRHKIGVEHFVQTNRLDRGAEEVADRNTLVNHMMVINAIALINMARKRLCTNADPVTRKVMGYIKGAIKEVDPELHEFLVIDCEYRGYCCEVRTCGYYPPYTIRE